MVAGDGKVAYNLVQENKPDLIITDIRMPFMDGNELANLLRSNPAFSDIPLIALSASVQEKSIEIFENFDDFIEKPVDINYLLKTISKYSKHVFELNSIDKSKTTNKKIDFEVYEKELSDELKNILVINYERKWSLILDSFVLNELQDFGNELREIGRENESKMLVKLGNIISNSVESFDIETLQDIVPKFSELMKKFTGK
jgi:CheY-like chemotaxis protein